MIMFLMITRYVCNKNDIPLLIFNQHVTNDGNNLSNTHIHNHASSGNILHVYNDKERDVAPW